MAASVPPRRNPTPTRISKQHLTPLQILLQMGFPKHRAEKALSATGNRGVQLASDWLLAHVNDALLDDTSPREYILYACPVGAFYEELRNFWGMTMQCGGWNGAHNFMPHITLVSFFKAPDENSLHLSHALKSVMERQGATLNETLKLETYVSQNFMGLFVADDHADYLKRIAMQYVKEVSNATISLEPHVKSLHLTLAYQFPAQKYAELKSIVEMLDPRCSSEWELRLYSRDSHVSGKQVFKVIHAYTPQENDELELHIGDFVYLAAEALSNSPDGWVEGTSWLTGSTGLLPTSYIVRTAESDAWTLHTKVPLNQLPSNPASAKATTPVSRDSATSESEDATAPIAAGNDVVQFTQLTDDLDCSKINAAAADSDSEEAPEKDAELESSYNTYENVAKLSLDDERPEQTQYVLIMRHGERVDFTFGSWIPYCFDNNGVYKQRDLNMPRTMPRRALGPKGFQKDSPLTNMGVMQATLVGEALRAEGMEVQHVYSSPAYRCVQTCDSVLRGLRVRDQLTINIEPGLFEWLAWYPEAFPNWMTTDELVAAGYRINAAYQPLVAKSSLMAAVEDTNQLYDRSRYVTKTLSDRHLGQGNILLIGHAISVEVCTRELCGGLPRDKVEMTKAIKKVPYCSLVMLERTENGAKGTKYRMVAPPNLSITHSNNPRFNWKTLM